MEKLYTVATPKEIIGMAGIMGPLTTPSKIEFNDVLEMVRKGYVIYQVNPYDHSEKVRVTISNINSIKFKTGRSAATIQRKLNREIQEMNKPMIVDVVSRESVETTDNKREKEDTKRNENKKKSDSVEKITKPDEFTK